MKSKAVFSLFTLILFTGGSLAGSLDDPTDAGLKSAPENQNYSPYVDKNFPTRPLWGDSHLHTNLSTDAGLAGNLLPPAKAYQFARGDEINSSFGHRVRLSRPLDWLAIADHSDGMGLIGDILDGDPDVLAFEQAAGWREGMLAGGQKAAD
ncbi:MAG: DUF3604 domain-containing protein, partial [Paracoccaceae bacterium]